MTWWLRWMKNLTAGKRLNQNTAWSVPPLRAKQRSLHVTHRVLNAPTTPLLRCCRLMRRLYVRPWRPTQICINAPSKPSKVMDLCRSTLRPRMWLMCLNAISLTICFTCTTKFQKTFVSVANFGMTVLTALPQIWARTTRSAWSKSPASWPLCLLKKTGSKTYLWLNVRWISWLSRATRHGMRTCLSTLRATSRKLLIVRNVRNVSWLLTASRRLPLKVRPSTTWRRIMPPHSSVLMTKPITLVSTASLLLRVALVV